MHGNLNLSSCVGPLEQTGPFAIKNSGKEYINGGSSYVWDFKIKTAQQWNLP